MATASCRTPAARPLAREPLARNRDALMELHGFADASERGYAAVVYLRITEENTTSLRLLVAKSKVAPVKQVSLPRLELCAAALLTNLTHHTRTSLSLLTAPVYLWSDSKVTLHWIQGHASGWKTYVANRVSQIQLQLPEARWRHVPGRDNPADCASRGITPSELIDHPLWWTGPAWLREDKAAWPSNSLETPDGELPEQRTVTLVATRNIETEPDLLLRFSSLHRLQRVTAWCLRWRRIATRHNGMELHPDELNNALLRWLRVVQALHYPAEIAAVTANSTIPQRSQLARLSPFIDDNGVLRVGGRLKHVIFSQDERHPLIVPPASWLTQLLVDSCHRRTLHEGVQLTLGLLRLRFWVPRGRAVVKQLLHRCATCARAATDGGRQLRSYRWEIFHQGESFQLAHSSMPAWITPGRSSSASARGEDIVHTRDSLQYSCASAQKLYILKSFQIIRRMHFSPHSVVSFHAEACVKEFIPTAGLSLGLTGYCVSSSAHHHLTVVTSHTPQSRKESSGISIRLLHRTLEDSGRLR